MQKYPHGPLPRMNALRAFEAAARLSSFSRAAGELGIRQPAVSRYIAELEHELRLQLFERSHRAVILTLAGEVFHRATTSGLQRIAAGALSASSLAEDRRVIVAGGHATSDLFVMPRFEAIRQALGQKVSLRILTLDEDMLDRLTDYEVDLVLTHGEIAGAPEDRVTVFTEAITPVCSPDFAATHAEVLARPVAEWGSLPFLRLGRSSRTWATWHDWFEVAGYPLPRPTFTTIEDYVYSMEAAVAGRGLALGWRHYIDRYIDAGSLVKVADGFVELDRHCFARLSERGRHRPVARRCLDVFGTLANETAPRPKARRHAGETEGSSRRRTAPGRGRL